VSWHHYPRASSVEHDLAHGLHPGKRHQQAVDAESAACGGGHAVFQCAHVLFVVGLGLVVVPAGLLAALLDEALVLIQRVDLLIA
jgi:hypothetical protein